MFRKLVGRLTYANVMATAAVFIAIGGGAYAAGLAKDSVGSKQIKAKAVKSAEIADNAVTSPKVADGSLLKGDFAAGQLPVTNLFAYVRDNGDAAAATVDYGTGVTGVSESGFPGVYVVTFNRSVTNCVIHATGGLGDPPGNPGTAGRYVPAVYMNTGTAPEVEVDFDTDTSFMVSAVC